MGKAIGSPFKKHTLAVVAGSLLGAGAGLYPPRAQAALNADGPRCGPVHQAYLANPPQLNPPPGIRAFDPRDFGPSFEQVMAVFDCYENLPHGTPSTLVVTDNELSVPRGLEERIIDVPLNPSNGSIVTTADLKAFVYTPRLGFSGRDTFIYSPSARNVSETTVAFSLTYVDVFVLPRANDDSYTINTSQSNVALDVVANDLGVGSFGSANALTVSNVTVPPGVGTATISNNQVLFTPNPAALGNQSFTYEVTDAIGQTATATVNLVVQSFPLMVRNNGGPFCGPVRAAYLANPPPFFSSYPDFGYLAEEIINVFDCFENLPNGTPVTLTLIDNDVIPRKNETLDGVYGLKFGPSNGTVTPFGTGPAFGTSAGYVYTPSPGFSGRDTFSYFSGWRNVSESGVVTRDIRVDVFVLPKAVDDSYTVNTAQSNVAFDVVANDVGVGSFGPANALTVSNVTVPAGVGTATISNNQVLFTPNPAALGNQSFAYEVTDAIGQKATAAVNVNVRLAPLAVNDGPFTVGCSATGPASTVVANVLANDRYTGNAFVTVSTVPAFGTAQVLADQRIQYTPPLGISGSTTLRYTLVDSIGTAMADVGLSVLPTTTNQAVAVAYARSTSGNALTGACGTGLSLVSVGTPSKGVVTFTGDGQFTYRASAGQTGADSFSVTARDASNLAVTSTVNVTIGEAPQFGFFYNGQFFDNTNLPASATGARQSALVGLPFQAPLVVKVLDTTGQPVPGYDICFTAIPSANGASAVLTPTHAVTDAQGVAQVSATANGVPGSYQVKAELCPVGTTPPAGSTVIRAKGSAPAVVAKQNLAGALVFALNNVLVDDSTSPIPVAPWPVLAWLASVLGWLGYRRTRAKRA